MERLTALGIGSIYSTQLLYNGLVPGRAPRRRTASMPSKSPTAQGGLLSISWPSQNQVSRFRELLRARSLFSGPAHRRRVAFGSTTYLKFVVAADCHGGGEHRRQSPAFQLTRDLAEFDFAISEINESLVRRLHRCVLVESPDNIAFIVGPGNGKTDVVIALAVQAVEHHYKKVRFFSTVELRSMLAAARYFEEEPAISGRERSKKANALTKIGLKKLDI